MSTRLATLTLFLLPLLLAACGGGSSPTATQAQVASVVLARGRTDDALPVDPTSVFPPDAREIWGIVTLTGVDASVAVTGVWSFLGPDGTAAPHEVARGGVTQPPADSEDPADTPRRVGLVLRKPTDFEQGIYQLDVLLNGNETVKLQFSVSTATAAAQGASPTPAPTTTRVSSVADSSATASPTAAVKPSPGGTYTVKAGDTLGGLAAAWGVSLQAVADLNGIASPYTIAIGQVLQVPAGGQVIPTLTPLPPVEEAPTDTPLPLPTATSVAATPTRTATPTATVTPTATTTP